MPATFRTIRPAGTATLQPIRPRTNRTPRTASESALRMLSSARVALADAAATEVAPDRYAAAHLAALRGAAAVLAARTQPVTRRPTSAWRLLTEVAPELGEWAACFAAGAAKRAAAEAGLRSAVSTREADDLVRDVTTFLALVETTIGALPLAGTPAG